LQWVVEEMTERPGQRVSEISLLRGEERVQVLVEWNRTEAEYPQRCVQELFEEHVERSPGGIAVVGSEGEKMSYEELNRRANRLGRYLRRLGVGPEARVGICRERGVEMVVALLGVLKAGGAYVPLDPGYPAERLQFMVKDAQAAVLLTQAGLVVEEMKSSGAEVICLEEKREEIEQEREENARLPLDFAARRLWQRT